MSVILTDTIHVQELLYLSRNVIFDRFNEVIEFPLEFDNGEIITVDGRSTIMSSIYWEYHRQFNIPLLPNHHMQNNIFGNAIHKELLSSCLWAVFDKGGSRNQNLDYLNRIAMKIVNDVFAFISVDLEEYVTTISAEDYVEIFTHPEVEKSRMALRASPHKAQVERCYEEVSKVIMSCPTLKDNAVAISCRAKLISIGQVLQAVATRGYTTDYDSHIFRKPVIPGYSEGLIKLRESAQEGRSGTKALKSTEDPLRKTEYFGRKIRLLLHTVKGLVPGDCGSTVYIEFHVTAKSLNNLRGKYCLSKDGKTLREITGDCKDLIGTMVKLRSPGGCKHRHEYNVCEVCTGTLSYSVPSQQYYNYPTLLGSFSSIAICSFVSQKVMGVKHEDGSSTAEHLTIPESASAFIRLKASSEGHILLNSDLKHSGYRLIVGAESIKYLDDINSPEVDNITTLATSTLATMKQIKFERTNSNGNTDIEIVNTSVGPRLASFSYPFLEYLKTHGWEIDGRGNYVIDLTHWKYAKTFLVMPQRHMNMLEYQKSIADFIEKKGRGNIMGCTTYAEALRKLYDIVNCKANVNIMHLEMLLLACIADNPLGGSSNCPVAGVEHEKFNVHKRNVFDRSLSATYAFERLGEFVASPSSFNNTNRPDHPFDSIMKG